MAESQSTVTLITGASSGIGLELARLCAAARARLVLTARNVDALHRLADECRSLGAVVDVISADLSTDGGASSLVAELARRGIMIDILINNAGFGTHGKFWENDIDQEQSLLHVNVVSL